MAITTTPVQGEQTLQIEAKSLTNLAPPALNIGDRVQLVVRQNNPGELGLVFFRGLLIGAQLPKDLVQGDKVTAEIIRNGDKVVFKIIGDILKAGSPAPTEQLLTPLARIENEFSEIFRAASAINLKNIQAEDLSTALRTAGQLRGNMERLLENLAKVLPQGERLFTPQEIIRELQTATAGGQVRLLQNLAQSIRQFVKEHGPQPEQLEFGKLQESLEELLLDSAANNSFASKNLQSLVADLEKTVKTATTKIPRNEQQQLREAANELKNLPQISEKNLAEMRPSIQSTLTNLHTQIANAAARLGGLDAQTTAELTRLAGHLDSIASAQEALEKLNPLLQALGEPAMILFPFLFQGLFSHTEVTVHSKKKNRGNDEVDSEDGGKRGTSESFRRIQVSAPLPHLGTVHVDVAVRSKEILVSLSVEDPAVGAFLKSRLPQLGQLLRDQGYEKAELFSHVGTKSSVIPEWSLGLHALHSVIA